MKEDKHGLIEHLLASLVPGDQVVNETSMPYLFLRYLAAPITPVLNVQPNCFRQSLAYIRQLLKLETWAVKSIINYLFLEKVIDTLLAPSA
jgi:hypothetical protein